MKCLKQIGADNDICIGQDGQLAFVDGKEAYAQIVSDALRTIKGEYIFDVDLGIPWFRTLLGHGSANIEWQNLVRERILEFDFVESILDFDYKYDHVAKEMDYTCTILTDSGIITVTP